MGADSYRYPKARHEVVTLAASEARTETGNTSSSVRLPNARGFAFALDVTAAATDASDTLDVFVQTKIDGTNWVDVLAFTQVTGNGGTKRHIGTINPTNATTMFENGSALSAGSVRHITGDEWRVRWSIDDQASDDASFTFSVTVCPM